MNMNLVLQGPDATTESLNRLAALAGAARVAGGLPEHLAALRLAR